MKSQRPQLTWLFIGDTFAVLVVSLVGFMTHYGKIQGWRWLSTFLPVLVGWFAIAPWLGVYDLEKARQPREVWRPVLAALLSGPLAATLRALWLNSVIPPIFVVVLSATDALGFLMWRTLWAMVVRRMRPNG